MSEPRGYDPLDDWSPLGDPYPTGDSHPRRSLTLPAPAPRDNQVAVWVWLEGEVWRWFVLPYFDARPFGDTSDNPAYVPHWIRRGDAQREALMCLRALHPRAHVVDQFWTAPGMEDK